MTEKIIFAVLIPFNIIMIAINIKTLMKSRAQILSNFEAAKENYHNAVKNSEHTRRLRDIERSMVGLRAEQENTSEN